MPKDITHLRVFVASPSDVAEERELMNDIINKINVTWGDKLGLYLNLVRWENHTYPGIGDDPQAVINEQIGSDYDIFIGIMGEYFGTPTRRADSGTVEEYERAYERFQENPDGLRIMFYFKDSPIRPSQVDLEQLAAIRSFKERLGEQSLYSVFKGIEEFGEQVERHLSKQVQSYGESWGSKKYMQIGDEDLDQEATSISELKSTAIPGEDIEQLSRKATNLVNLLVDGFQNFTLPSGLISKQLVTAASTFYLPVDFEVNSIVAWAQSYGLPHNMLTLTHLIDLYKKGFPPDKLPLDGYKIAEFLLALRSTPNIPSTLISAVWKTLEDTYIVVDPDMHCKYLISNPEQPHGISWAGSYLILALTIESPGAVPNNAREIATELADAIYFHLRKGSGIKRRHSLRVDASMAPETSHVKVFGNSLYGLALLNLFRITGNDDYIRRSAASVSTICELVSNTLWDENKNLPLRADFESTNRVRALAAVLLFLSEYLSYRLVNRRHNIGSQLLVDYRTALAQIRIERVLDVLLHLAERGNGVLPTEVSDTLEEVALPDGLTQAYGLLAAAAAARILESL
jgi:hypothetical protein